MWGPFIVFFKSTQYKKCLRKMSSLPCLPVPDLNDTLRRLMLSAKPFLTKLEICQAEDVISKFNCPGGEGEFLQCKLVERAEEKENWLTDWWKHWTYLGGRSSLVTNTSVGITFPMMKFETETDLLIHASKIVASAVEFKHFTDENKLTRETMGTDPMDKNQYKFIFGASRIPCSSEDYVISNNNSDYIIVSFQNNYFKVVVKEDLRWMKQHAILQQLKELVVEKGMGKPVGLLTTDCRDTWSKAYDNLRKQRVNCETLRAIEGALFVLCLDTQTPPEATNKVTSVLGQCYHGDGPDFNGSNRWFDKMIQFIVGQSGCVGVCYEPSLAEVDVMTGIMDFIHSRMNAPSGTLPTCKIPEKLKTCLDQSLITSICFAESHFKKLVCDVELFCFKFNAFGKNVLKSFKISPDSFVQMSIQLTHYRMTGDVAPQCEIASTRKFKEGRSEVIRSCSEDTVRFVKSFCDPDVSLKNKYKTLQCALNTHLDLVASAVNGQGIDRHLLGLKIMASENNMAEPNLFSHPVFTKSSSMQLNTYQMTSKFDGFMIGAPMLNDGYSCFYNILPDHINVSISAFVSSDLTNASEFGHNLNNVLIEMRDMITQTISIDL